MDYFINHFDKSEFLKYTDISNVKASLFLDNISDEKTLYLNPINIIALQEPNEYFGYHDWVIDHKDFFSYILTWDDKILNNCKNSEFLPFGHTWLIPDQINKVRTKRFEISHLCGKLKLTYGHSLRNEILNRENEIIIPKNFHYTFGNRDNISEARIGKETIFGESMFGVAIENTSHNGYFTEKIMDLLLMKTIPIYWGCTNIGDFFNIKGILQFRNIDEFVKISNNLSTSFYTDHIDAINENYELAHKYINYIDNIHTKIKNLFLLNKLL